MTDAPQEDKSNRAHTRRHVHAQRERERAGRGQGKGRGGEREKYKHENHMQAIKGRSNEGQEKRTSPSKEQKSAA